MSEEHPCPSCRLPLDVDACSACGYEKNDPRIGIVLDGKVRVEELIGRGGMGRVYSGEHLTLGAKVAVKFVSGSMMRESLVRARFRREALALAKLRHPGVVSVLDFGEHGDELYMVMELVSGTSLGAQLEDKVPMGLPAIGAIFDQLLFPADQVHVLQQHLYFAPDEQALEGGIVEVHVLDVDLVHLVRVALDAGQCCLHVAQLALDGECE